MSGCAASRSRTTQGLEGHSDADVGLHALTDALLGAIGDGDIGQHFPPSDPKWKGAASHLFLEDAGRRVREKGGRICNVDVTLLCEAPRVGPHRDAMRAAIAEMLGIDIGRVGVKATTTEGLGFTGRKEGIAAHGLRERVCCRWRIRHRPRYYTTSRPRFVDRPPRIAAFRVKRLYRHEHSGGL